MKKKQISKNMLYYIFQDILTLLKDINSINVWLTLSFDHYVLKRVLDVKSIWTCANAAKNGHLEVLKWLRENGCPWDDWTCLYAAEYGHLEVLKWVRENGCPWDEDTCALAAWNGHLEVLKWARENGCPWNWLTCASAAQNDHLEVLKWARENRCPE